MIDLKPAALILLWFSGLAISSTASAQNGPDFLLGDWNVASDFLLDDGSMEQTSAVAGATTETIVGSTTWIRQTLVGTRQDQDVEVATTFALNPATAEWIMFRADSAAGTVDVASGASVAADEWLFTSLPATRPDGGLDQFRYTNIGANGYTLTVSRSFDGGTTWEIFWTQTYTRAAGPVLPSSLPGVTTCAQQEYGQFDFWLGDWDLVSPSGQSSGDRGSIHLATGDCVVEEAFLPTSGGGASRSMYDARTGQWARVWIEPGRMLIFIMGGLVNDDMIMTGGSTGSSQLTNRTIWQPMSDNRVRQFTQTSADNGATWTDAGFDAIHVPQGSPPPPPPPPPPPSTSGGGGGAAGLIELLIAGLFVFRRRQRTHNIW